jgi:hypothetical protein
MAVRVEPLPHVTDDETAAERAVRRLAAPDVSAAERINTLRTYSDERCVELNSDGLTWDCPADPADVDVPESAVAAQEADVLSILDEFDIAPFGD